MYEEQSSIHSGGNCLKNKHFNKIVIESKNCTKCHTEKSIKFPKKEECKDCHTERVLRRYFDDKDELFQQQKPKNMHFRNLVKTYVKLENNKSLEEKVVNNVSILLGIQQRRFLFFHVPVPS